MSIARALLTQAQTQPDAVALHWPEVRHRWWGRSVHWRSISYAQLRQRSLDVAAGLQALGLGPGVRTVVMVRPGCDFFVLMYALFLLGAIPVLIDPGLDRRALKQCLAEARPSAFIGVALAQFARLVLGWGRRSVRQIVTVGRRWWPGGWTLAQIERRGAALPVASLPTVPDEALAAVLFTSGSTGVPKGVAYTHAMFAAQVALLRSAFGIAPGGINLPTFPPFALFDPALGLTSVIPEMDPRHPARADPARLAATIERFGCTLMFGSPALIGVLGEWGQRCATRLATLRTVISAGAPVAPEKVARMLAMLPDGARLWTPYGATEALPVAVVEAQELLADVRDRTASGAGICVGRPLAANTVRIIAISDVALGSWADVEELPTGTIGEITVRGPSVTHTYDARPAATALAKIVDRDGAIVHRMGDLGYFDDHGRLWFAGRKSERVQTAARLYFTECVEQVCNEDPAVLRSALVGIGQRPHQRPVLCIERRRGVDLPWVHLCERLHERLARVAAAQGIDTFLEYEGALPVDIRHNAKIGRSRLAEWATRRLPAHK